MNTKQIRKEKAILIKKLEADGHPNAYSEAGKLINEKYGRGWSENPKYGAGTDTKSDDYVDNPYDEPWKTFWDD